MNPLYAFEPVFYPFQTFRTVNHNDTPYAPTSNFMVTQDPRTGQKYAIPAFPIPVSGSDVLSIRYDQNYPNNSLMMAPPDSAKFVSQPGRNSMPPVTPIYGDDPA